MNLVEFINQIASIYVPHYHRCYFGNIEICNSFFDQIISSSEENLQSKNLGIITLQKYGDDGNYIIIDGYQRIINLILFHLALRNQQDNFIQNLELKINNNDKVTVQNIIDNNLLANNIENCRILEAYNLFEFKLKEHNYSLETILNNLKNTNIINVILEDNIADIENIYDNLNQNFSQVDLIRNFVYKQSKAAKLIHIFNTYWLNLEKTLGSNINRFIVDYLTIQQNGVIPKQNNLYKDFVEFFNKLTKFRNKEDAIKHIYRYSSYYTRIINSNLKDTELRKKLEEINNHKAYDTYPYLMEVFEDYEYAHINKHILLEILDTVILFINKRNKNSNDLMSVNFASLSKDINKMLALKNYTPKIITQDFDDNLNNHKMTINELIQTNN